MSQLRTLVGLVLGLSFTIAVSAHADPVTHWNAITVSTVGGANARPGPPGLLDIALVQTAVFDAVQVIEGRFQAYHYSDPSRLGVGSTAAAVAAASRGVLVRLYSAATPQHQAIRDAVEAAYADYLDDNDLESDPALDIGDDAAAALYADQYRPVLPVTPFFGHDIIGQWRSAVPMGFQHLAISTPFTLNRIDQFRPPPPPPMTSMTYVREYDEVKRIGTLPKPPGADEDLARFWAGNYVAQWNEALRQISDAQSLSSSDAARLFALANLAAADAAMAVWESKIFYNVWRPSTAIQQGDDDPNPRTAGDGGWAPMIPNPPYPDYVSGANGLTGAFTGMARLFFGTDTMSFSVKNPAMNVIDKERDFTTFSQAAQEVVDARVLLGIHFRFADEEARRLGERVAHWAFQKFLRPVPGSH